MLLTSHGVSEWDSAVLVGDFCLVETLCWKSSTRTKMVHNISPTPFWPAKSWTCISWSCARIHEKVVKFLFSKRTESVIAESLDAIKVWQLQRKDSQMVFLVIFKLIVCCLGCLGISGSKYEFVRLRVTQHLLDSLKPLHLSLDCKRLNYHRGNLRGQMMPQ